MDAVLSRRIEEAVELQKRLDEIRGEISNGDREAIESAREDARQRAKALTLLLGRPNYEAKRLALRRWRTENLD